MTDHAIVRYLERVHGVDTDSIRILLATPTVEAMAQQFTRCKVSIPEADCTVVLRDGAIVTVEEL